MTETVSHVYDLTFPGPITLQEMSSIVIVVELWREEIRAHVKSKRLDELHLKDNIALKTALPSLPSTIYNLLEEYVDKFRQSIFSWHSNHYCNGIRRDGWMNILSRFDDFAWDWDGTIHTARTAKRMMMCDQFTEVEKFKIACLYCFEDDIKRIWPSVSETMDLNEIYFHFSPELYYWICYFRNELHKIPNPYNEPIEERMVLGARESEINWFVRRNPYSVMYFWNRLPRGSQSPNHVYANLHWPELFARFILPTLNEHQLDTFVAANGVKLVCSMLNSDSTLVHVLPTWMYIRSRIDITNFSNLINKLLIEEASMGRYSHYKKVAILICEIWKSAPKHFKRSVLDIVLYHNERLFRSRNTSPWKQGMKLLITILQDATVEERNVFWHENWPKLVFSASVEDLVVMMKFSFQNENEITLFKKNIISIYENIAEGCALWMKLGMFKKLNQFLSVCCLDEQKRIELKRRLLRTNYIGENSVFTHSVVRENKLLNEFINAAFQNAAELGVEFRNQLTSSPVTQNCLLECICSGDLVIVIEFVDTFFPDEQVRVPLKVRLFEHFKEHLIAGSIQNIYGDRLEAFLFWFLGSTDEVTKFKQSVPVEDIFCTMMRAERRVAAQVDGNERVLPYKVDDFLMWYFNKDVEETEKFTKLFVDEFGSFCFTKRRKTA